MPCVTSKISLKKFAMNAAALKVQTTLRPTSTVKEVAKSTLWSTLCSNFCTMNQMQELLVYGELLLSMRQVAGRIELQWRTWTLLFELVSRDGNLCTSVISRYA